MIAWFRRKARKPIADRVVLDDTTVRVYAGPEEVESFRWADVVCVHAWKQDCFTMDRIWLGFETTGSEEFVSIHEEMDGYGLVMCEMQRRCVGFRPNWWMAVAFPAFVENHTVVWRRPVD